jgi:hypothetical protein
MFISRILIFIDPGSGTQDDITTPKEEGEKY